MKCPNCGATLEPYDTFCSSCGKYALPLQNDTPPAPLPVSEPEETIDPQKAPQKLYPPPEEYSVSEIIEEVLEQENPESPEPPAPSNTVSEAFAAADETPQKHPPVREKRPPKPSHKGRNAAIFFALIAIAAVAGLVYVLVSTSTLKVQVRKAQMEQQAAESHAATLEAQLAGLQEELTVEKDANSNLSAKVTDLNTQINSMETSVNQSQYDKESAQRERDEAIKDADDLTASIAELETNISSLMDEKTTLESTVEDLKTENSNLETELAFYDSHVVFVMTNSSDKLYHKYNCPLFDKKSFLAYNPKLAEANGYEPCSTCCQ